MRTRTGALQPLLLLLVPIVASRTSHEAALQQQLQSIVDKHAQFWNASFSFAIANSSVEVAVAAGGNDLSNASSKLTPEMSIPQGSTTKMFSSVSILRLAEAKKLSLDDPIAPLVNRYLARSMPCATTPPYCEATCVPHAYCYTSAADFRCKLITREQAANCSYCLRHLHCFANVSAAYVPPLPFVPPFATPFVPPFVTLTQLWDNDATIEKVTFRHLLSMSSGVKDYYYDTTNWLFREVTETTRDVEPLEYLVHMDKAFLFEPGATTIVPAGKPGAGRTVRRGSYSTNGFSLIGLALAGLFNLSDWAALDQRSLAWGNQRPDDDRTFFPTRGLCSSYDGLPRQYMSTSMSEGPFVDISEHSCLNSWLGGNIAARPLDVARFTAAVFGGKTLLSDASLGEMLDFHPLTDGFDAYELAYGIGLEGQYGGNYSGILYCGLPGFGHEGLDYGSGGMINSYVPGVKLGLSLAMTSAKTAGTSLVGMNCTRDFDQLGLAPTAVMGELLSAVFEFAGLSGTQCNTLPIDPPASCADAPSFGTLGGYSLTCQQFLDIAYNSSHLPYSSYCTWLSGVTLVQLMVQVKGYTPPSGYDPATTTGGELCKATCEAYASGPCWMRKKTAGWCPKDGAAAGAVERVEGLEAAKAMRMARRVRRGGSLV